jgi:Tol biopolymer transport system component
MALSHGSIAFFGTYRPPVPLDIFSCPADPPPSSDKDEVLLTDDVSYNQNGQPIPLAALKELLTFLRKKNPKLASECGATPEDAEKGRVTGMVFVSERDRGLETLHVALRSGAGTVKVLSLGDIYGAETFGGVRMEDSGCIAGGFTERGVKVSHSLVYVSTKEPVKERRTPWTVVYRTNLADGKTERLTPKFQYDVSPAVSPSGRMVAVANFTGNAWNGEIENLKTDVVIMNLDKRAQGGRGRDVLIEDAGWPTWGSDNVIFFHRGFDTDPPSNTARWAVFRYDIAAHKEERVTPEGIDTMTPAAISETKVAVATIREKSKQVQMKVERTVTQYRHIEIFDMAKPGQPSVQITQRMRPEGDHYNPFVLDGGSRIGYHRCRTDKLLKVKVFVRLYVCLYGMQKVYSRDGNLTEMMHMQIGAASQKSTSIQRKFDKVQPPPSHADVGLFRVTGVFPSISKNGKKLAFVDNEFKAVWLADSKGLRVVYQVRASKSVFSTSWNQNDDLDTLYVCEGPAFSIDEPVQIMRIPNVSRDDLEDIETFPLTEDLYNCAFPSSNPEGTKLVFRSSRNRVPGAERKDKNLFIIDAEMGESAGIVQLTDGPWTDTHCSWSPREGGCDWIVFSSSGRPEKDIVRLLGEPEKDHGLDPGYFAVYLVNAKGLKPGDPVPVPVRVIHSAPTIAGHVNHPVFSPDMRSIVFAADLAAVSADPISMPHFTHSVRPYGDIFSVNLRDTEDMSKNKDIQEFHRITHSRYEYSTPTWTSSADNDDEDPNTKWKMLESVPNFTPRCPYARGEANEKEGWHMTGHLPIKKRCC